MLIFYARIFFFLCLNSDGNNIIVRLFNLFKFRLPDENYYIVVLLYMNSEDYKDVIFTRISELSRDEC